MGLLSCVGKKTSTTTSDEKKPVEFHLPAEWAAFDAKESSVAGIEDISSDRLAPPKLLAPAPPEEEKKKKAKAVKPTEVKVPKHATIDGMKIPNRRPAKDPIWVGEKIYMDVTWLAALAGDFVLEVKPHKFIKNRKVYNFRGEAKTSKLFSMIYRAEDTVETFVDFEGWFPYKFTLHGDESKHVRDTVEVFDHAKGKQYVHQRDDRLKGEIHEDKMVKDLTRFSQDSLSSLYYLRTQKYEIGSTVRFPMTTGGEQWEMAIHVLNREVISTQMGEITALKMKVETRFNGGLRQAGDAFLWISDDEHKYPIRFEAKVKIGWVSGITKKIEPGSP